MSAISIIQWLALAFVSARRFSEPLRIQRRKNGAFPLEQDQVRLEAGISQAKAAGVYLGGKVRLDHGGIRRMASEGHGPTVIAKALGCSRMQVYRVLRQP